MTARMRRIASDWEQVKKDFTNHQNIIITPLGEEPPEKYKITYFINGIYLLPDGRIETLGRHEVEITLHAEYPRYKPICKILTPIWHPNFRDGQICIGDIWGAGESLSDIIINIGDMIQYKSWNSYSPLSADAAKWAIENKHLFPVGNIGLYKADYTAANEIFEIDLFDDNGDLVESSAKVDKTSDEYRNTAAEDKDKDKDINEISDNTSVVTAAVAIMEKKDGNDFEITADELANIKFVPTAQRMQSVTQGSIQTGKKINFKTVFMKGLLWGLIGGIIGFIIQEVFGSVVNEYSILGWMGYNYNDLLGLDENTAFDIFNNCLGISTAFFTAFIAFGISLFMGIGEGVFYGSSENAIKYAAIGSGISLIFGFVSGYIAQIMYVSILDDATSDFQYASARGIVWAVMGLSVGLAIGLIKPEKKRILFCSIGGLCGGFIGGFIFNFIGAAVVIDENDTGMVPRAIGITIMGILIGLGIGLLEQFAKQAWLKVIRGDFEGKEYLVFAGTTSIGNTGKNTIVLFKDKLVGPHHCDIILEGSKYVLHDTGTPMGTVVNGMRINRHILKKGDTIAIGNSVLVFNTK